MMTVSTRQIGAVVVVEPQTARLDACAGLALRDTVRQLAAHSRRLVVNLSRVSSIDGAGLGSLVNGLQDMGPTGDFRLCALQPAVRARFTAAALDRVMNVHESEAQSLGAMLPLAA